MRIFVVLILSVLTAAIVSYAAGLAIAHFFHVSGGDLPVLNSYLGLFFGWLFTTIALFKWVL